MERNDGSSRTAEKPTAQGGGAATFAVVALLYALYLYARVSNHIAGYIVGTVIGGLAVPVIGALLGAATMWSKPRYRWSAATIGFILIIALMYLHEHRETMVTSTGEIKSNVPLTVPGPTYDSIGWTEENTGIDIIDPWETAAPAGVRYYRNAQGIIYRVYPPGMRPDLPPANPFGLGDSTASEPPRR